MQRFRGGLVFKADRLCVSLNSRLESNKEEAEDPASLPRRHPIRDALPGFRVQSSGFMVHVSEFRV